MKYKKIKKDNYEIYYYKTDKFKTINIETVLINDYDPKDITMDNYISEFLLKTNANYKDEISMNKKYMDLFNPKLSIHDVFRDYHIKYFSMTFLSEKYLGQENNKKLIDFYYDIIFNPNVVNNSFEKNNSKLVIDQMKSDYLLYEENPREKAYKGALKSLTGNFPFKYNPRGNKKDLKNIDFKEAYKHYKDELNNSKYIVFITGNIDDNIFDYVDNNLRNKVKQTNINIKIYYDPGKIKYKEKIDKSKFNQSILYIAYKIPNITIEERKVVLPLLNNILGGASSKLFNNVREKNSLAYYVYSSMMKHYGILYINAGISYKNYDRAIKVIEKQIDDLKKGNISNKEINDSIKAFEANILKSEDNLSSITSTLEGQILFEQYSNEEFLEKVKKVTKKELIDLSNKLELDFIYLLKEDTHENN